MCLSWPASLMYQGVSVHTWLQASGVMDALPETFMAVRTIGGQWIPQSVLRSWRGRAGQEPHEAPAETNKQAMCTGGDQSREIAEQEASVNPALHRGRVQERRD